MTRTATLTLALSTLLAAAPAVAQDTPTPEPATEATPEASTPEATTPEAPPDVPARRGVNLQRTGSEEDVTLTGSTHRTVFSGGRNVQVGVTAPDVVAAGEVVETTGRIADNFIGAGREVRVLGPVGGDALILGETLTLSADIAGDLYALGESLRIPEGVTVGGNVYFAGADFDLAGAIGGDLLGAGANFDLDGRIGGDVTLEVANLDVGPGATVVGTLEYTSPEKGIVSDGASVGAVDWTMKAVDVGGDDEGEGSALGTLGFKVGMLLAALLAGAATIGLFPRALSRPAELLAEESPVALGVGFALLLGVPVLAAFLAVFILPIPLSLFSLAVYVPALYLARLVAAYALGWLLLERMNQTPKAFGALAVGVVVLHLLYAIPLLGGLVTLGATILGLGALFLAARRGMAAA